MFNTSILCISYSRQRDAHVGDRRVPAQLRCPSYAMQLSPLRENRTLLAEQNQIALCSGTSPLPRDLAKHKLVPFAADLCPFCPHLLLGIH